MFGVGCGAAGALVYGHRASTKVDNPPEIENNYSPGDENDYDENAYDNPDTTPDDAEEPDIV